MTRLSVHRHPELFIIGLLELLVLQFVLCYPAAVCRGIPALKPFWHVSVFLAVPLLALLPAFDDFSYAPRVRVTLLVGFCIASAGNLECS